MSQGLGKVEKLILKALKKYGDMSIDDLTVLKVHGLDFFYRIEDVGSFEIGLWDTPAAQSIIRAVRKLTALGLVKCSKCLLPEESRETKRKFTKVAIC